MHTETNDGARWALRTSNAIAEPWGRSRQLGRTLRAAWGRDPASALYRNTCLVTVRFKVDPSRIGNLPHILPLLWPFYTGANHVVLQMLEKIVLQIGIRECVEARQDVTLSHLGVGAHELPVCGGARKNRPEIEKTAHGKISLPNDPPPTTSTSKRMRRPTGSGLSR